ncbi:MAG TPA: NAD(P)-binding domain-containing protein, partial [Pedococcus sp.]|nr:NAD(P)-binding domain-containing protein [Pedococcus sp.]
MTDQSAQTTEQTAGRSDKVAILGVGVMGETLLSGLLRAGRPAATLLVGEKRRDRAAELRERYGVEVVADNLQVVRAVDTVVLVVKPQDMGELLDGIAPGLQPGQLVVSLAAGITTSFIESHLPEGVAVVRVMPNTPALVDEGMSALSAGSHCDAAHLEMAESLLRATGKVLQV